MFKYTSYICIICIIRSHVLVCYSYSLFLCKTNVFICYLLKHMPGYQCLHIILRIYAALIDCLLLPAICQWCASYQS